MKNRQAKDWWTITFGDPISWIILSVIGDYKWVTPIGITWLSFFAKIIPSGLMITNDRTAIIGAAILLQLGQVLDSMDGNLARYRVQPTLKGGFLDRPRKVSTTMIIEAGKKLQTRFAQTKPSTPPNVFNLMTTQAMSMKTAHAILTVETQGILQFLDYSKRIMDEAKGKKGNRANKWLSTNSDWKIAHEIAKSNKTNHPKLSRLVELI